MLRLRMDASPKLNIFSLFSIANRQLIQLISKSMESIFFSGMNGRRDKR